MEYIRYKILLIDLNTVNELSILVRGYESFIILVNILIFFGLVLS